MADALGEYLALRARVDGFAAGVAARRAADLACRRGCAACCQVELTLSPVEAEALRRALRALPPEERAALRGRSSKSKFRQGAQDLPPTEQDLPSKAQSLFLEDRPGGCALLGTDGACLAYEGRPLVCRSEGLPLRYPAGLIPAAAVRARAAAPAAGGGGGKAGELTWCPLNFRGAAPAAADTLDAGLVDEMLALVNRRYAAQAGLDPLARTALRDVLAEALAEPDEDHG